MKIECDKCSAKYSIADEKVRGKTFKIRCKKCSNVIIVRDKSAASAPVSSGTAASAAATAAQPQPGWHLAIQGETVGPMSAGDVRQRFASGQIDRETAVWQEGFEDWVPLGDVAAFSDLPSSVASPAPASPVAAVAAAHADDPFASANQDDYAATAGAAVAAGRAAAAAAADLSAPEPGRSSSLTGQRNENSVLFSLESLQSLASTPAPAPARPASAPARGLATSAPSSEGSGLIDIRALGSMVAQSVPAAAATAGPVGPEAALPSFGGVGLGGLTASPLVPPSAVQSSTPTGSRPAARSNTLMAVLLVVLILAVVGVGVGIITSERAATLVPGPATAAAEAPSVKSAADRDDKSDGSKEDAIPRPSEPDDAAQAPIDNDNDGDEAADDKDADNDRGRASPRTSRPRRRASRGGSSASRAKPKADPTEDLPSLPTAAEPKSEPKPAKSGPRDPSVECILDPSLPKCKGGGSTASKPRARKATPAPAKSNLPEKLAVADIRDGVDAVKSSAKACGKKHDAPAGTKVKVRISIAGATGTVSSAAAQAPHAGTPLGNCVAAALKKAKFKKFQKESMGAVYPVSM